MMINLLILALWAAIGAGVAAATAAPGESRWAWAPVAAFFGPLWLSIAMDRRTGASTSQPRAADTAAGRGADPRSIAPEAVDLVASDLHPAELTATER